MDLLRACFPQQPDNAAARRAADDGVVDENKTFAADGFFNGAQLNLYLIGSCALAGRYEGCLPMYLFLIKPIP